MAILSRGYGSLAIDILGSREFDGPSDQGGEIRLKRSVVDTYPRKALVNLVARELAYKVDNMENPHLVARLKKPRQNAQRRVASILERWGFPPHEKMVYTPADEERIKASRVRRTQKMARLKFAIGTVSRSTRRLSAASECQVVPGCKTGPPRTLLAAARKETLDRLPRHDTLR